MHEPGLPAVRANAEQLRIARRNVIRQCAGIAPGKTMRGDACRFVDDQDRSIFVDDRYLQIEFRQRAIHQQSRETGKGNPVTHLEPIALAPTAAVDGERSIAESAIELTARKMR